MSDVVGFVPCPHRADVAEWPCGRAVRIAATGVAFAAGGRPSGLQWLSCQSLHGLGEGVSGYTILYMCPSALSRRGVWAVVAWSGAFCQTK